MDVLQDPEIELYLNLLPKSAVVIAFTNFIKHLIITLFPKLNTLEMTVLPPLPLLLRSRC